MTVEGYFSDPVYGGNSDMVAWRMIGFPGAYASYYDLVDKHGIKIDRAPMSIAEDAHGHIACGSEHPGASCTLSRRRREQAMTQRLKAVDVVIIGVGMVGSIVAQGAGGDRAEGRRPRTRPAARHGAGFPVARRSTTNCGLRSARR